MDFEVAGGPWGRKDAKVLVEEEERMKVAGGRETQTWTGKRSDWRV